MTSLYDADLGADAVIRRAQGPLRQVRHSDATLIVDSTDEIALNLSETHVVERRMDGHVSRTAPRIGSVMVMPPGCPTRFNITGTCSVLQLRLPWSQLVAWLAEEQGVDPVHVELQPRLHAEDPVLTRLLCALATEDGDAETMVRGVVIRLFAGHASQPTTNLPVLRRGGLPATRLRRVQDLIEAGLHGELSLSRLAGVAGMSPFHFAREFARATGLPPHRYVLRRRVDRAIEQLARAELTVAEIARDVGFAHTSHLARHMHRRIGLSPEAFRAQVLT